MSLALLRGMEWGGVKCPCLTFALDMTKHFILSFVHESKINTG